jgi:hypothetical protein
MRVRLLRLLAIAVATVVMGGFAATAEASGIQADVPFSFIVNGTRLPAGDYVIRPLSDVQQAVWAIQNRRGNETVFVLTGAYSGRQTATPELNFAVMGGQHFLSRIVTSGRGVGRDRDLTPKGMERELIKADEASAA